MKGRAMIAWGLSNEVIGGTLVHHLAADDSPVFTLSGSRDDANMKVPKKKANSAQRTRKSNKPKKSKNDHITEMLKVCLQKVCELQQDLERSEDFENDPQAAGYTACAMETLRFLAAEGLPPDHPIVQTLSEKLTNEEEQS